MSKKEYIDFDKVPKSFEFRDFLNYTTERTCEYFHSNIFREEVIKATLETLPQLSGYNQQAMNTCIDLMFHTWSLPLEEELENAKGNVREYKEALSWLDNIRTLIKFRSTNSETIQDSLNSTES